MINVGHYEGDGVCVEEIRQMFDEMAVVQRDYLPEFING